MDRERGRFDDTDLAARAQGHASPRTRILGLLLALGASAAHADPTPADPSLSSASVELRQVAHWVLESRDNAGMPFLLVDKRNARVFAFDRSGRLQGDAPALLGLARGDRLLAPNDTKVKDVPPQSRITPAGRFLSRLSLDEHGEELLVIDYDASISLHPVVKGTPEEHRAQRLGSPTSKDNRISYGCINVPASFYTDVVSPAFTNTQGLVYILPETESASALFGMQSPSGESMASAGGTDARAAMRSATAAAK